MQQMKKIAPPFRALVCVLSCASWSYFEGFDNHTNFQHISRKYWYRFPFLCNKSVRMLGLYPIMLVFKSIRKKNGYLHFHEVRCKKLQ
jgi:hypothetical protein